MMPHLQSARASHASRGPVRALALSVLALCATAASQVVAPADDIGRAKPVSATSPLLPVPADAFIEAPELDFKRLAAEDEASRAVGEAPRYAVPHAVSVRPSEFGHWQDAVASDGRPVRVWRMVASCPNAVNMNLGFSEFRLPPSATLFVHSPDLGHVVRGFSHRDHADHGQLWTPPVPGNELVIELAVDPGEAASVRLRLGSVNAGYRRFGPKGAGDELPSGSCNVDVACGAGDGWRDEIASVAVISTGGSRFCTGFMVNNVRQDLTPFFMTAAHCGVTQSNAPSLVAFWNFEHSSCRVPGSPGSGGAGNGSLAQFSTGSTWLASYSPSDMTLVRLSASPSPAWFVSYAGWDATPADAASSVAIHHPSTEEKRISFDDDPATTTGYLGEAVPGDGTHVRITQWDVGTTEPGSSGSPLFSQDHRVTGQLHGGYASCTSLTSDWYGRFSVSWNGGGTPSTQLRAWLDPDGTGTLVLNTLSTRGLSVSPAGGVVHKGRAGGPFTNDPFAYTLSNSTAGTVNWTGRTRNGTGLRLNGSPTQVGGTLAPGQSATVVVTCGPAINALPVGVHAEDVIFTDLGTGVERVMAHSIEVGLTSIEVTPALGLETGGPVGGPFAGTRTYVVASTSPSPVTVAVSSDASWITVDGSTSATFTLPSLGSSRQVTVGIGPSASGLAAGTYAGVVTFANSSGGSGGTTRSVDLEIGRVVYPATDVPLSIADNSVVSSSVTVPDSFCVGDVDVVIDLRHTYVGDLVVDLVSPSGTVVRLHNRGGGSADDLVLTYDDDGAGTAPSGPGALGDLDGTSSAGSWTLRVADQALTDVGTLNGWSLRMVPLGATCPERVVFASQPLDTNPGWAAQGQWAFGTPTGGGNTDPVGGHTGSNAYGYNLAGNYPDNMPAHHLTSTAFDCRGHTGVRVSFWRDLGVESSQYDKAAFSVSTDGTTWTQVWQHSGATVNDAQWTRMSYDISSIADGRPAVYLRWTMGTTDGSVVFAGWNIDDIELAGFPSVLPCPADQNDDGAVNGLDLGLLLGSWGPCPGCGADLTGDGVVDGIDLGLLLGEWGTCD